MFVSRQLKEKNIAEYLIYMWQIEDLIRANGCDMEKIKSTIIAPYPLTEEQKAELTQWYMDLIEMMRHEGIMEKGHLQINKNIITWLTDLHLQLLRSPKFPYYNSAYYKVLPYIVELRAKGADKEEPELETCFEALYGILLLKLQKKEISEETRKAQEAISTLLAMLSNYYIEDKKGELELSDDLHESTIARRIISFDESTANSVNKTPIKDANTPFGCNSKILLAELNNHCIKIVLLSIQSFKIFLEIVFFEEATNENGLSILNSWGNDLNGIVCKTLTKNEVSM